MPIHAQPTFRTGEKISGQIHEMKRIFHFPLRFNQKIYGKVAMGETVTVEYEGERHTGEVFYIHPKRRFFEIVTKNGLRETFYFPINNKLDDTEDNGGE